MSDLMSALAGFDPIAGGAAPPADVRGYVLLDVFTDSPLAGNQLAVFTDGRGLDGERMQQIARELNLSESVFVLEPPAGSTAAVRIFTPSTEMQFAGHPVLGSGVVLAAALGLDELTVQTGSGPVALRLAREDPSHWSGWMEQPVPTWKEYARERELLAALGLDRSGLPVELYDNGPSHVYVALESEQQVAALVPDQAALARLEPMSVNCFAGADGRFKTRMFAPGLGVAEDPATGSAAGPLAVHLCRHGRAEFGHELEIRQGAEVARPSLLRARVTGSRDSVERVDVGGSAVFVGRGELRV